MDALRAAAEKLQESARTLTRDTTVRGVGYEVQSSTGRRGAPAVAPGALRKITAPSKGHPEFARLRADERVLAMIRSFGVHQPACQLDQLNLKLPRVGTGFPFHQDAQFLIGKTRGRIERHGGLNLIIALDRADARNGALEMLGRTHTGPLLDIGYDTAGGNRHPFDQTHRALIAMEPGDAVLFHPNLAHGSGPNRSPWPRRMVTLWFVGAGAPGSDS